MLRFFKRNRCKQCGWDLSIFSTNHFCSDRCSDIFEKNGELLSSSMRHSGINLSEINKTK